VGEALLEPHRCYYNQLKPHMELVKGLAHITGGGLIGNVPRVLPAGLMASFETKSWSVPAIFGLIQKKGNVTKDEMFHVFNMGIGMTVICSAENAVTIRKLLPDARIVGEVMKQVGDSRVVIDGVGYHKDKIN
jgi:phosphoribosylformylglycinamidine cyclo-ligase